MPEISVGASTYHYHRQGRGDPLVLLHGFTGRAENWAHLQPQLAEKCDTIALDLPGHGRTIVPYDHYTMPRVAADLVALFQKLDFPPIHLWGYSMGGRLALYLAVHYPQHIMRLILESASPGLKTAEERAARQESDAALANRIKQEGIPAFVDYWEQIPLFASQQNLPEAVRQRHRKLRLQNRPEGLAHSLRGMGAGVQPSLWPHLPQLHLPVQLIVGELDEKYVRTGREMAALMPAAHLHIVPHAGHTVHLEQPTDVFHLVAGLLNN